MLSNHLTVKPIISPSELAKAFPATHKQTQFIKNSRQKVRDILRGNDPRLILIVGPCSIHDIKAAKEYARNLQELIHKTSDSFFIIMRTYFEKPRTCAGWKGLLYDPFLDGSSDIEEGLRQTRKLLLELADDSIPAATEFLDPLACFYFEDLVAWGCIGARTATSPIHRALASSLSMPISFKNTIDGNVDAAVYACMNASLPQVFIGTTSSGSLAKIHSNGNPDCHITLRGGKNAPNYDALSVAKTLESLKRAHLPERVLIDCSHGNSGRNFNHQPAIFKSVIQHIVEGNQGIKGLLLESNLFEGSQAFTEDLNALTYGISLTDPCLGFEETKALILESHAILTNRLTPSCRLEKI